MNEEAIKTLALEVAKGIKTEQDLSDFFRKLTKITVEAALNAEMESHLGYSKHTRTDSSNSRNGAGKKQLLTEDGPIDLSVPRDRDNSFEPQLVKKHQRRFTSMNERILSLYAKGMTTREIEAAFEEMYGAEISPALISKVTESVMDEVIAWQSRPLEALYPIAYLDGIVVKVRQDKQVINKFIFLALGVNLQGRKELLGIWLAENEGAKFWLSVLTELKNRGVKDILIACVDGLKGFPDAIHTVYPETRVQLCVIHMIRNSLKFVSWRDYKAVSTDLKQIYQSVTEEEALKALESFSERWDVKYPQIAKSWKSHWHNLNTLFDYPEDIRKAIYTTNAIESLNSVIRKAINKRKLFPTDDAARKVVYLAILDASKKWSMPIKNWKSALNRFMIEFEDRISDFV
jgi:transposase-like protein